MHLWAKFPNSKFNKTIQSPSRETAHQWVFHGNEFWKGDFSPRRVRFTELFRDCKHSE